MAVEEFGAGTFGPGAVASINRAYESAFEILDLRNGHAHQRSDLAKCLLHLAKEGETDEIKLRDRAIAALRRMTQVRERAHQLWEEDGRPVGRDEEHWRRAEQEIEADGDGLARGERK